MAKRHRWICPSCGSVKLASSRPKKRATVRFCLPCSEGSGELVERTCPALDKRREAKANATKAKAKRATAAKQRRKKKAQEQRQADAEARHLYGGYDLRVELKRLCGVARRIGYSHKTPKLTVRWRHKGDYTTGYAWYEQDRIHLTIPKGSPAAPALAVLAHEIAHCASPVRGHGQEWRWVFRHMAEQAYGCKVEHVAGCTQYELHQAITRSIAKALGEDLTDAQLENDEEEPQEAACTPSTK